MTYTPASMGHDPRAYARDYERLWSPVIRPMGEAVLPRLRFDGARRVLDVATGCGALVPALQAAAPGAAIFGVDLSSEMVRLAGRREISGAAMNARCLGLRDLSFDVAIMVFMLFMLPDPVEALREARRVLRDGGALGVVTWGEDSNAPAQDAWEQEIRAAGAPARPAHPGDHLVNAPEKMERLCAEAGLEEVRAWSSVHEHRWTPDSLIELKTAALDHRFLALPEATQRQLVVRARARLESLDGEAFVWRPTIGYCVARRRD